MAESISASPCSAVICLAMTWRAAAVATVIASSRTSRIARASALLICSSAAWSRRAIEALMSCLASSPARSGLFAGLRDDAVGLRLRVLLLALVARQQRLRLLADAARLVEIGPDRHRPRVELAGDQPGHLEIDQHADEQQKGEQHDEIGVRQRQERVAGREAGVAVSVMASVTRGMRMMVTP